MGKALHSEEEIIAAGEEVTAERGQLATAWQVHQRLGGRGKLSRYEQVWAAHCTARSEKREVDLALPEAVETQIEKAVEALRNTMTVSATDLLRTSHDQSRRQLTIVMRDHEEQMTALRSERDYLKDHVSELEGAIEKLEQEAQKLLKKITALESERADTALSKPAQARKKSAPRRSPDRAPAKTRPAAPAGAAADTEPSTN